MQAVIIGLIIGGVLILLNLVWSAQLRLWSLALKDLSQILNERARLLDCRSSVLDRRFDIPTLRGKGDDD